MSSKKEIVSELVDFLHDKLDDWYEDQSPSRHDAPLYLDVANTVVEMFTQFLLQTSPDE